MKLTDFLPFGTDWKKYVGLLVVMLFVDGVTNSLKGSVGFGHITDIGEKVGGMIAGFLPAKA